MPRSPKRSKLRAGLKKPPGAHGVLPVASAAAASPPPPQFSRFSDFLEFAQAAGGFGVFDLNLATGEIGGTALFFELIGLPHRDLTLTREEWVATIHPGDLEAVMLALGSAIDSGNRFQFEYRAILPSGDVRWLAGRAQVLKDGEGCPGRAIGTVSDITERKQLEEKLRYATESLNIAQTGAGLATFDFNFGGNSRICSDNFHALLGIPPLTPLDDLGLLLSRVHPDDVAGSRNAPLETTPEEPSYRCEYRVMLDGGGGRWIREKGPVVRGRPGEILRITGAIVDVSDLKRTKAALDSVESRFERAIRGTHDGLWEIDLVTDTLWFGPHFEEMLGYGVGELSDSREHFRAMIHPEDREMVGAVVQNHFDNA